MKKVFTYICLGLLSISISNTFANECDIAKLSYFLERATYYEDRHAFHFALDLGANPDGVTEELAIKCFAGMPNTPPVLTAVDHKDTYMLKILLEKGASPNAACCDKTALGRAKELKKAEAIILLKKYGAN